MQLLPKLYKGPPRKQTRQMLVTGICKVTERKISQMCIQERSFDVCMKLYISLVSSQSSILSHQCLKQSVVCHFLQIRYLTFHVLKQQINSKKKCNTNHIQVKELIRYEMQPLCIHLYILYRQHPLTISLIMQGVHITLH